MKPYLVPVDWDAMEPLVISVLKEELNSLRKDWDKVYKTKRGFVWSTDYEEDLKTISEHISAYKKIIKYHGGTTE